MTTLLDGLRPRVSTTGSVAGMYEIFPVMVERITLVSGCVSGRSQDEHQHCGKLI
jgi:hypothetical protein